MAFTFSSRKPTPGPASSLMGKEDNKAKGYLPIGHEANDT